MSNLKKLNKPDDAEPHALDEFLQNIRETDEEAEKGKKRRKRRQSSDTLAEVLLKATLPPDLKRRIRSMRSLCLVVDVPGADWSQPVTDAMGLIGRWSLTYQGDPNPKNRARENGSVTSVLSAGGRVLGVSHAVDSQLPTALLGSADARLTLAPPSEAALAKVILAATGRRPKDLPVGIARSLTYSEICAAIRIGSTPAQCVARLVSAAAAKTAGPGSDDVPLLHELAGYGAAMDWCTDLLADVERWRSGTASFPTSARVVFAGPPGTGKTTLVRSLAKTGRLTLIATSVGAWFADSPGNLDSVIKQIVEVFKAAQAAAPSVLFLDEIDAIPNRATMSDRGRDWWLPVVTFLLTTLDSAVSQVSRDIVIIGATNHAHDLDAALVRPGRLERIIEIETPDDPETRVEILRTQLGPDLREEDLSLVGRLTPQATGADLAGLVRRARRNARAAGRDLTVTDLMALVMPPETRDPATLRRVAVHEAGHVIVSMALGLGVRSVSIVQGEGSAGRMLGDPVVGSMPVRSDMEKFATISMGGAAAEEVILGERSVGAGGSRESDLARTTGVLAILRVSFGLGGDLLFRATPDEVEALLAGDAALRRDVEADMRRIFATAKGCVERNVAATEALATSLTERRFLGAADIDVIVREAIGGNGSLTPNPKR